MTAATVALAIGSGVLGLAIGSFLNVVVWRVPRGVSVVAPRSACPGCHTELGALDNIPLVSWAVLGGRCRTCRMSISAQYPLVELATGVIFAIVAAWSSPALLSATDTVSAVAAGLEIAALLVLAASSISLALIDLQVRRLPNPIVLFLVVSGIVLLGAAGLISGEYGALAQAGIGGIAAFAIFFAVAFVKPGGMGFGDVKLAGALGIYLGYAGWGALVVGFFAAFLLGGVVGISLIVARRIERGGGIPFGPWMLVGAWVGIVAGDPIARLYLSFVGIS